MKKLWLIEVEGTPKALERLEELLDRMVEEVSYDNRSVAGPAPRALVCWRFKNEKSLTKWLHEDAS